jgi:hypothetical protein
MALVLMLLLAAVIGRAAGVDDVASSAAAVDARWIVAW